ncbi:MAG: hypothetical protein KC426_01465 [Oceanospirillaceae bacterium]|nr:hypothetical protein [Oceanospirillaceae bacterium]
MAVQDQWLKASQHRLTFSKCLWQDLVTHYGNKEDAYHWAQRPQRMAYQYAIVDHLLSAAKYLAQASLKQLANTRFDDIDRLTWPDIEALLIKQDYLSAEAQQILALLQEGDWAHWIKLQGQSDFSIIPSAQAQSEQLIATQNIDDLSNPDHWPVQSWVDELEILQTSIRNSMQEW